MRKDKYGIGVILILLILFNVIAFAVPHRQSSAFWPAYVFTVVAIMMQFCIFPWHSSMHITKKKFFGVCQEFMLVSLI